MGSITLIMGKIHNSTVGNAEFDLLLANLLTSQVIRLVTSMYLCKI